MAKIELMAKMFAKTEIKLNQFDGFVIAEPITKIKDDKLFIDVPMLTQGKKIDMIICLDSILDEQSIKSNLKVGNLVEYKMWQEYLYVPNNQEKTFNLILSKENATAKDQFVMQKYGPEFSPNNGEPGSMVAAGWVYAKTNETITIGDGRLITEDISGRKLPFPIKRYEETYMIDKNIVVYEVNTERYNSSKVSDFNSINITKDYDYKTTDRQAVYLIFDKNYKQVDKAKAVSIYYFTPMSKSDGKPVWDVPEKSYLLKGKGIDPISNLTYDKISATYPHIAPYSRSTEPFEVVKDTCYYVGDNEVAMYLLKADMGSGDTNNHRLMLLDCGWPYSGYQYWKNIEAVGYDPRKITDILLTHGHFDHYGTAMELINMIENSGGSVRLWGSAHDTFGLKEDAQGNKWDIKGALPDEEEEIRKRTIPYKTDKQYNFGNIKMLVTYTPGHSTGAASFIFCIKDPETDKYLSFCYQGGFGYPNFKDAGYLRWAFTDGLAYLEQKYSDVDYVMPQHTNHYPWVEIYQALKAYNNDPANQGNNKTFLQALRKGELINFAERRYQVATNELSEIKSKGEMNYISIENSGPYKPGREKGLKGVRIQLLDNGIALHGFDKHMNKNPEIPLLKDGIIIARDSWTHDPEGWYVQFSIKVFDDYKGYIPEPKDKSYRGGPVESIRNIEGTPEILRTQRLDSKEEADLIMSSIKAGEIYYIDLTKSSKIIVPENPEDTFRKDQ